MVVVMAVNWIDRSVVTSTAPRMRVTKPAAEEAARLGLTTERLAEMAYLGAYITHPQANRRFDRFIMSVKQDMVHGVWLYAAPEHVCDAKCNHNRAPKIGRWTKQAYPCPICEGEGGVCMECRGTRTIHCTADEYERLKYIAFPAVR